MKPILIDAIRINTGGGLSLLNYLITRLCQRKIDFILLKDSRCPRLNDEDLIPSLLVMNAKLSVRRKFYLSHQDNIHSIFCFGNVPPPIKLNVPVYTYYHNVSFLKIPKDYSLKLKISSLLKRLYIKYYRKNTDIWMAQTTYTASLLNKYLVHNKQPIEVFPFYKIIKNLNDENLDDRTDYVYVGEYTNAKGQKYLLEAWRKLFKEGFKRRLHLTVTDPDFCKIINQAYMEGVLVINHGHIPPEKVYDLYKNSKATIYPSLNESLGLGIVEAAESGCDIIGVNLPYMLSICKPSYVFQSCNPESIVKAVKEYERKPVASQLLIYDMIDELINRIIKN